MSLRSKDCIISILLDDLPNKFTPKFADFNDYTLLQKQIEINN